MARTLTTPDRVLLLLSLVAYLKKHGSTPVSVLSQHFDVSDKLIRKLAMFLGTAGIPGETLTYQHEDLFDIDWDALYYQDEVNLVRFIAVEETPRFSSAEISSLVAGLISLRSVLPADMQTHVESVLSKLNHANTITPEPVSVSVEELGEGDTIREIAAAIQDHTQIQFEYVDAAGAYSQRTVEPSTLKQSPNGWYLYGYCLTRNAERVFIVDRMRNLVRTTTAQHSLTETQQTSFPEDSSKNCVAIVKYRDTAAHLISEFQPMNVTQPSNGWLTAEIELRHPGVAPRLIQRAPGDVVVLSPESARKAVYDWALSSLAHYSD